MRILLADDEPGVRLALRILLEHERDIEIAGEIDEASKLFEGILVNRPDIVLIDWELTRSGMNEIIQEIRLNHPALKIVALSGRPEAAKTAVSAGVDAFVSKGENSDKLLKSIYSTYPSGQV